MGKAYNNAGSRGIVWFTVSAMMVEDNERRGLLILPSDLDHYGSSEELKSTWHDMPSAEAQVW